MARINYKLDKELANQGLLRVSVVAKALNVAPKTVNAWTKYNVAKVGGVKYLAWHEVISDKPNEQELYRLSDVANEVYNTVLLSNLTQAVEPEYPKPVVSKTNDVLAKAKALVQKKAQINVQSTKVTTPEPEEILTVQPIEEPDVLTIPDEYKHLLRK